MGTQHSRLRAFGACNKSMHLRKHFVVAPPSGGRGGEERDGGRVWEEGGEVGEGGWERVLVGGGEGKVRGVQALLFLHFKHCIILCLRKLFIAPMVFISVTTP